MPVLLHLVDLAGGVEFTRSEILNDLVFLELLYLFNVLLVAIELFQDVGVRILYVLESLYDLFEGILLQIVH